MSAKPDRLRLALIGAGRWGRNYIQAVRESDSADLAILCSRNPDAISRIGEGTRVDPDWHSVLKNRSVDGVIIATPPAHHGQVLRAALDARVPALVEKPLTLDLAEAQMLRDLSVSKRTPFLVNHIHLFSPAYAELKRFIKLESVSLGPIRRIASEGGNLGPIRPDYSAYWDYAPHDVAFCLDLMKSFPVQIKGRDVTPQEKRTQPTEGCFELELEFAQDAQALIRAGNLYEKKMRRLEIRFVSGDVLVLDDLADPKLVHLKPSSELSPIAVNGISPLAGAVRALCQMIQAPAQDTGLEGPDFALAVTRVLSQGERGFVSPSVN